MKNQDKNSLRFFFKQARASIPTNRRSWAQKSLKATIERHHSNWEVILSYTSFNSELETSLLNNYLAQQNRLALPKIVNNQIEIFKVTCPKTQLKITPFGIMEPNENLCEKIEAKDIKLALIAGICFDSSFHRIGYGKGHYDRFVCNLSCPIIGIGYIEQYFNGRIPLEPHDKKLDFLSLF